MGTRNGDIDRGRPEPSPPPIVMFSLTNPGLGPRRISASLAQPAWGGLVVSPNGVWRVLRRHGLSRWVARLSLVAGYAARPERGRPPEPERHVEVSRPGELVGFDCFHIRRLSGTRGKVWQYTAIDLATSYALFGLAYALFALAAPSVLVLGVAFAIAGVAIGAVETGEHAAVAGLAPEHQRGSAFGLLAGVQSLGDLVASAMIGLVWTLLGPGIAFAVAVLAMLASLASLVSLRPKRPVA